MLPVEQPQPLPSLCCHLVASRKQPNQPPRRREENTGTSVSGHDYVFRACALKQGVASRLLVLGVANGEAGAAYKPGSGLRARGQPPEERRLVSRGRVWARWARLRGLRCSLPAPPRLGGGAEAGAAADVADWPPRTPPRRRLQCAVAAAGRLLLGGLALGKGVRGSSVPGRPAFWEWGVSKAHKELRLKKLPCLSNKPKPWQREGGK